LFILGIAMSAAQVLPTIHIPTLIISANKDRATIVEASRNMHAQIEGSKLVVLAPSGHIMMMEQHPRFVEAITSFVRKCSDQTHPSLN